MDLLILYSEWALKAFILDYYKAESNYVIGKIICVLTNGI